MFAYLKESEASKIDNPRPVDLSPECLSMMEKLMLAQAQVRLRISPSWQQICLSAPTKTIPCRMTETSQYCLCTGFRRLVACSKYCLCCVQECVYHKAVMDKKSPSVLARLAKQAGNLYGEASSMFNGPILVQHFERSWVSHTQMKVGLATTMALFSSLHHCSTTAQCACQQLTLFSLWCSCVFAESFDSCSACAQQRSFVSLAGRSA